jgi:hypothetical protein
MFIVIDVVNAITIDKRFAFSCSIYDRFVYIHKIFVLRE